jgi:hypothetical protein
VDEATAAGQSTRKDMRSRLRREYHGTLRKKLGAFLLD